MPDFRCAHHISLTVRDRRTSADWYQRSLGFAFVKDFDVPEGEAGIPRILLLHRPSGFLLGLCEHRDRTGDSFDPLRTGLDHVAFEVTARAELDSWVEHFDRLGIAHSLCANWTMRPSFLSRILMGSRSNCGCNVPLIARPRVGDVLSF